MAASKSNASRKDITNFLQDFKEAIITGPGLIVRVNQKNLKALGELGITRRQREELLLSLSVENYSSGPEEDSDFPGDVWIFGIRVDEIEVYIKLKLVTKKGVDFAHCFSFHAAEHPLYYPYKQPIDN